MKPELIYLASPYTHADAEVRRRRYEAAMYASAIIAEYFNVFSPIVHSAPLELVCGLQLPHDEWLRRDLPFMEIATRCVVLKLPGWEKSTGVMWEIQWFGLRDIPITLVSPEGLAELIAEAEQQQGANNAE